MINQEKFAALKKFNLPKNQYAITGSGPLGIRNLREIQDIDIIVTPKLRDILAEKYGITKENGMRKIIFPGSLIEAFWEGSFYTAAVDEKIPTITSRIASAEIINELPFDSLENILQFKRKLGREKDLKDILLIEEWMRAQKLTLADCQRQPSKARSLNAYIHI